VIGRREKVRFKTEFKRG